MPELKEIAALLEDQKKAFDQFKQANDERLEQIEKKGHADPLLESKVDAANDEINKLAEIMADIEKKLNRPGNHDGNSDVDEHSAAFKQFVCKGHEEGLRELEAKALNIGTDADGGYAVPERLDRNILDLMEDESPMRKLCNVIKIGGENYKKLVNLHGAASGWVGETASRPQTDSPQLAELTPYMGEIYANPAATQTSLDDIFFDAESWLADEVATEFAQKERLAFLSGDGTNKPKGILDYTSVTTVDGTRAFGQLQHILAASTSAVTFDELITVVYALRKAQRSNAVWMTNTLTLSTLRKIKDSDGNYIWQPSVQAGQPTSLLGYSLEENEDCADMAADAVPILFGNFRRGYTIVDRMGIRTLRDPYTNKPYVHFYTTKRVGGFLADSESIKLLKNAAA